MPGSYYWLLDLREKQRLGLLPRDENFWNYLEKHLNDKNIKELRGSMSDCSKLFVEGFEIKKDCPVCKTESIFDGDVEPIISPKLGTTTVIYIECPECEHIWKEYVIIRAFIEEY